MTMRLKLQNCEAVHQNWYQFMLNQKPTTYKECAVDISFNGEVDVKEKEIHLHNGSLHFNSMKTKNNLLCRYGHSSIFCNFHSAGKIVHANSFMFVDSFVLPKSEIEL